MAHGGLPVASGSHRRGRGLGRWVAYCPKRPNGEGQGRRPELPMPQNGLAAVAAATLGAVQARRHYRNNKVVTAANRKRSATRITTADKRNGHELAARARGVSVSAGECHKPMKAA
jgi:hypothetical protein